MEVNMLVYVAMAGEYEVFCPLGIFEDVEKAKKCVEDSEPSYNTEVAVFDTEKGCRKSLAYYYDARLKLWG